MLILIIIGVVLLLTQKIWVPKLVEKIISNESSSNISTTSTAPQNFVDQKSGLSFEYPGTWSVVQSDKKYSVCLESAASTSCSIGINIVVSPDEKHEAGVVSNEDLIALFKKRYPKETVKPEQSVVNGLHVLKYSAAEETEAFIETDAYDYNFIASSVDEQGNTRTDFENNKKVLDSILQTVRVK